MKDFKSTSLALAGILPVSALVAAGATWFVVVALSLTWEGSLPNAILGGMYIVRIVAFFGMLVMLGIVIRAVIRFIMFRNDTSQPESALSFYALAVMYATFGMAIPIPGIAFLEPPVYLGIALLLLLAVQLRAIVSNEETGLDSHIFGPSRPDAHRATMLTLVAIAAVLGASGAYAWLAVRGAVMDCFVGECTAVRTVGVVGVMAIVGTLTAIVVLGSLRTQGRVTTLGIIATTLYACLALVALALPISTLMPYDFFAAAFWYALAGLAFLVCQSRLEADLLLVPTHLVMEPWDPTGFPVGKKEG